MDIVLLGPPGAGKGTQGERLADLLEIPHISTGHIFRDIARSETALAREVRSYMDRGQYVPDELTIALIISALKQPAAMNGAILDGFPRTTVQGAALESWLTVQGREVNVAFHISAPTDVLVKRICGRLTCGQCGAIYNTTTKPAVRMGRCDLCDTALEHRLDEEPDAVQSRLDGYIQKTVSLIRYYADRQCLFEIDGSSTRAQVDAQVDRILFDLGLRGSQQAACISTQEKAGSCPADASTVSNCRREPL